MGRKKIASRKKENRQRAQCEQEVNIPGTSPRLGRILAAKDYEQSGSGEKRRALLLRQVTYSPLSPVEKQHREPCIRRTQ